MNSLIFLTVRAVSGLASRIWGAFKPDISRVPWLAKAIEEGCQTPRWPS